MSLQFGQDSRPVLHGMRCGWMSSRSGGHARSATRRPPAGVWPDGHTVREERPAGQPDGQARPSGRIMRYSTSFRSALRTLAWPRPGGDSFWNEPGPAGLGGEHVVEMNQPMVILILRVFFSLDSSCV